MVRETPVILDLGKKKRKAIKDLKKGRGKLVDEVMEAVSRLEASLGEEANGKTILPVVVLYKEKKRLPRTPFPFRL
jgi:hypothetical protein